MGTLAIIKRMLLYSNWPRHPLVRHEVEATNPWTDLAHILLRVYQWVIRGALLIMLVAIVLELVHHTSVSVFMTLLMVFMPLGGLFFLAAGSTLMVIWTIPLALNGSIALLRERTARTWDVLLMTSVPHSDLLLSKLAVGLNRQQPFLTMATLLQVVPLIGLLGAVSRHMTTLYLVGCTPVAILGLTVVLFAIDRLQQLVFVSLLGLVVGLVAENWAIGIAGAAALGALFWVIHSVIAFMTVYLVAGDWFFDPFQAVIVGFPALSFSTHLPGLGLALLAGIILLQELSVRVLFRWLLRHVSH